MRLLAHIFFMANISSSLEMLPLESSSRLENRSSRLFRESASPPGESNIAAAEQHEKQEWPARTRRPHDPTSSRLRSKRGPGRYARTESRQTVTESLWPWPGRARRQCCVRSDVTSQNPKNHNLGRSNIELKALDSDKERRECRVICTIHNTKPRLDIINRREGCRGAEREKESARTVSIGRRQHWPVAAQHPRSLTACSRGGRVARARLLLVAVGAEEVAHLDLRIDAGLRRLERHPVSLGEP